MTRRAEQREETRQRIVDAAAAAFSELGFKAASTRDIAKRADTNQGLITYHFRSKEELWRAAAAQIFESLRTQLEEQLEGLADADPRERARESIRTYVRYAAAHPELFQMMVEEAKQGGARMEWIVDTYLRPVYESRFFPGGAAFGEDFDPKLLPHFFYTLAGAASVIFANARECERLTGMDPTADEAVERHADFVARLLVP
ncbi:MAG: TetR family transcriptional regulator [Myxococcota bacterium]|nr:TetR family transcriptional regulator [Myxococcota bacterium]